MYDLLSNTHRFLNTLPKSDSRFSRSLPRHLNELKPLAANSFSTRCLLPPGYKKYLNRPSLNDKLSLDVLCKNFSRLERLRSGKPLAVHEERWWNQVAPKEGKEKKLPNLTFDHESESRWTVTNRLRLWRGSKFFPNNDLFDHFNCWLPHYHTYDLSLQFEPKKGSLLE